MWILPFIGYLGVVLGFSLATLSIASGLYYLSELVEEHTVLSKKLLTRLIQSIVVAHLFLLLFDGFPKLLTLFSAASHFVYLLNVSHSFPFVRLSDPIFILSCALVLSNHFLWFSHFSNPPLPSSYSAQHSGLAGTPYDYVSTERYPTFTEIASFFGICVWLVPFALFVSLSASDNVLPSSSDSTVGGERTNPGIAKVVFGSVVEWCSETAQALGFRGREGGRGRPRSRFD